MLNIFKIFTFVIFFAIYSFSDSKKNILIIHTYHHSVSWVEMFNEGLQDIDNVNFFIEYMSIHKLNGMNEKIFVDYLSEKYKSVKLDGIITESHGSSLILQKYNNRLFKHIPQLHITNFKYKDKLPNNIKLAKVNRPAAIKKTAILALKQNPNAKEVYIIHDSSKASLLSKKTYEKVIKENSSLEIKYIDDTYTTSDIIKKMSSLPKESIVLYSPFFKGKQGNILSPKKFLKLISENSSVAIYSWASDLINAGSIGGSMIDVKLLAKNSFNKLLNYIQTKEFTSSEIDSIRVILNYPILQKYHKENILIPKEATLINKPVSVLESHFKEVVFISGMVTILIILVILLLVLNRKLKKEVSEKLHHQNLLIQQAREAEIGGMVGAITHQIKQPINVIALAIQNLSLKFETVDKELKDDLNETTNDIMSQIKFMNLTIYEFRNFFKKDNKSYFYPIECAKKVQELFKGIFEEDNIQIKIHEKNVGAHFDIFGLKTEFMQIFLNLFNNTKDALKERKIEDGEIDCYFEKDEKYGIIIVKDNAGGIPKELLPNKIFESYVSTKNDKGTGIGLHIVKSIIEKKLNGTILVENVNDGAQFTIKLPLKSTL